MSFLSRAFQRGEARDITGLHGVPNIAEDSIYGPNPGMWSQSTWTHEGNAMALGAFYACVTLLSDTIASLPIRAYREVDSACVEVSPQPRLFQGTGPYPETTWFEWLWMLVESLAVTGNGFGYVTARDPQSQLPIGVMPVHPDVMQVQFEQAPGADWPEATYRVNGVRIPADDVVHVKRFPIAGRPLGMSPIQNAAAAVGLGLAAERYGLQYFRDSANPSSVLESDLPLDDEGSRRLQQQWVATHGGKRRPAILSGGVKWRPIAISPNESQFLETRQFQRSEIAMWFRIPPHMIGDTTKATTWGTGLEQQSIGFVTYTLRPWLTSIEQALTRLLPRGQFAKFDIDGLLRGDVKTRWEAYNLGRNTGVYSVNDIRAMEDLPPVEDGDGRIQPLNFVPLGTEPPEPGEPANTPSEAPESETPDSEDQGDNNNPAGGPDAGEED